MCYVRVFYASAGVFQGGTKKKRRSQGDSHNFYYHYMTPNSVPNDESNEAQDQKRMNRYVQKTLYDKKCLVPRWLPNLDKSY